MSKFVLAVLAAMCALTMGSPASAEWRRAESARFIVYSNGREGALRDYVQKLEIFDMILRRRMGLPLDEVPVRKLPIYLVNGRAGLTEIFPTMDRNVVGRYAPTTEDIFATALRGGEYDFVLLHEYVHHFMYQNVPTFYPGWLSEGLAEYYMTAEIIGRSVKVGNYNAMRAEWLVGANWIPLEELLSKSPYQVQRGQNRNTYYPVAWILTHWFMSDPERRVQLQAYIDAVAGGADPVEAMQEATGLDLGQLQRALQSYLHTPLQLTRYNTNFPAAQIAIEVLPSSADDLLLIGQRLKVGVAPELREATAAEVRRLAARYPDDPFAMLQLGHAELHFGDPAAAEVVLTRLLDQQPDNVEALQLMAMRYITLAEEAEDPQLSIQQARTYLTRAYAADDASYQTLMLLGRTREGSPSYPTENDVATWAQAFSIAPQLSAARLGYARALMQTEQFEQAAILLRPLANAPHGGGAAEAAQTLLERAEAGLPPPTQAEIAATVETEEAEPPEPTVPPANTPPEDGEDEDAATPAG